MLSKKCNSEQRDSAGLYKTQLHLPVKLIISFQSLQLKHKGRWLKRKLLKTRHNQLQSASNVSAAIAQRGKDQRHFLTFKIPLLLLHKQDEMKGHETTTYSSIVKAKICVDINYYIPTKTQQNQMTECTAIKQLKKKWLKSFYTIALCTGMWAQVKKRQKKTKTATRLCNLRFIGPPRRSKR